MDLGCAQDSWYLHEIKTDWSLPLNVNLRSLYKLALLQVKNYCLLDTFTSTPTKRITKLDRMLSVQPAALYKSNDRQENLDQGMGSQVYRTTGANVLNGTVASVAASVGGLCPSTNERHYMFYMPTLRALCKIMVAHLQKSDRPSTIARRLGGTFIARTERRNTACDMHMDANHTS